MKLIKDKFIKNSFINNKFRTKIILYFVINNQKDFNCVIRLWINVLFKPIFD